MNAIEELNVKKLLKSKGKLITLERSATEVKIKLVPNFGCNAMKVFEAMKEICALVPDYPTVGKMITDEDNFELTLKIKS